MAEVCLTDSPTVHPRQEHGNDGALMLDAKVAQRGGLKVGASGLSVAVGGGVRTNPVGAAFAGLFTGGGDLTVKTMAFQGQAANVNINGTTFPTGHNALTDSNMVGGVSPQSAASGTLTLKAPITAVSSGTLTNDSDRLMWVFWTVSHPGRARLISASGQHWNVYPALAVNLATDPGIGWFEYSVAGTRNTGVSKINSGGTDTFWSFPKFTGLVNLQPGQSVVIRQRYNLLWNIALSGSHVDLPTPLVIAYGVSFA